MTGFGWSIWPVVVAAIGVSYGSLKKFRDINIIQRRDIDGHESAADFRHIAAPEGPDAAMPAELRAPAFPGELRVIGFEMIFREFALALQ